MVSYRNQIIELKIKSLLSMFDHFYFFSTRVECLGSRLFGISFQGEYKWCKSQCLMTENLRKRQYFSNPPPLDIIIGSHHYYLVTRVTAFSELISLDQGGKDNILGINSMLESLLEVSGLDMILFLFPWVWFPGKSVPQ